MSESHFVTPHLRPRSDGDLHPRLLCANISRVIGKQTQCPELARSTCSRCHLVKYCGQECQKSHWPTHRHDCKRGLAAENWMPRWAIEKRSPHFIGDDTLPAVFGPNKYLWGNVPAFDVLNLKDNEGVTYGENLRVLFAASGDIRNLVQTIVELPKTYTATCTCVLNDRDPHIVIRNAIMLLTSVLLSPDFAAEMMLHLWYSARLPSQSLDLVLDKIIPLIRDVCEKIAKKGRTSLLSKAWDFGPTRIQLLLKKAEWEYMLTVLLRGYESDNKTTEDHRKSIVLSPLRVDHLDRHLLKFQGHYRVGVLRFRETGILVPFGTCIDPFDKANSTLFNESNEWMLHDAADPLDGWSPADVLNSGQEAGIPQNDPYGALYFHVRQKLTIFCEKLRALNVDIRLFNAEATLLPDLLAIPELFDRIEVTNLPDRGWLGVPATLFHFGSLLGEDNAHATIVGLFLNAVAETQPSPTQEELYAAMTMAKHFMQLRPDLFSPELILIQSMTAMDMARDLDGTFDKYMKEVQMREASASMGLKIKAKHTVISAWPFRLYQSAYSAAAKRKFDLLYRSGLVGWERYVEWKRTSLRN